MSRIRTFTWNTCLHEIRHIHYPEPGSYAGVDVIDTDHSNVATGITSNGSNVVQQIAV